jgi:predicted NBD/HSP70 family sugar kinase
VYETRATPATIEAVLAVLYAGGPLERASLAERCRLSRPSISVAVAELLRDGIVEEVRRPARGRGRPSHAIQLSTRRVDTIGIELGRGHVAVAVADPTGAMVATDAVDVDPVTTLAARAVLALELLRSLADREGIDTTTVRRIAAGTPGPRFRNGERVHGDGLIAELEHDRATVASILERQFGCPVDVGNNTRYSAVAEAQRRRADATLVYLRVDEGIGGGIVQHGQPLCGAAGVAGEMGHVSVDPEGERCACGGRGCLELVAALPTVLAAAGCTDLHQLQRRAGAPRPRKALRVAATATGRVLAGVLPVVNPTAVVIGGAVGAIDGFLATVDRTVRDLSPSWTLIDLTIEAAITDHELGAIGAAAAAAASLEALKPRLRRHP